MLLLYVSARRRRRRGGGGKHGKLTRYHKPEEVHAMPAICFLIVCLAFRCGTAHGIVKKENVLLDIYGACWNHVTRGVLLDYT